MKETDKVLISSEENLKNWIFMDPEYYSECENITQTGGVELVSWHWIHLYLYKEEQFCIGINYLNTTVVK